MARTTISQRELRNDSGDIMRRVDLGESFVITRNGTAIAALTPLRRHPFVAADRVVAAFRSAPPVDRDAFRTDLDDLADPTAEPHV